MDRHRALSRPCACTGTVSGFSSLTRVMVIGSLAAHVAFTHAAEYPVRPVRLVVVASGGAADILARLIGGHLSSVWGKQVVVDTRPGGSGVVAAQIVARAAPDGHTLLFTFHGHTLSAARGEKLTYDPIKDFTPITQIGASGSVLTVNASAPVRNLAEFIEWSRAKKANLTVGVPGMGSGGFLAASTYNRMVGVNAVLINHAGSAPALLGVIGKQYDYAFSSVASAMGFIRNGQLRALGVTLPKRIKVLPGVPALAEALPGFDVSGWWGVLGPAHLPHPIVSKLHSDIVKALETPKVEKAIEADGTEIVGSSPDEFSAFLARDLENWKKAVSSAAMRPSSNLVGGL
jgi:tripartite-type tricarboxylate transporter receptor subunit TctC